MRIISYKIIPPTKNIFNNFFLDFFLCLIYKAIRKENRMSIKIDRIEFCGREITNSDLSLIVEVVQTCSGIGRTEFVHTVCELLEWKRPGGGLKVRQCRDLLEQLQDKNILKLPRKQNLSSRKMSNNVSIKNDKPWSKLSGSVESFVPIEVELVRNQDQKELYRNLVGRYHYLGYTNPFGARLQYLAYVSSPQRQVVGCIQFSSPAWKMKDRDQWIGWDDKTRGLNLQHVVNNSRFLVLPKIRNLPSMLLSIALKRLRVDWKVQYGLEPCLVETLVDKQRFHGGCYRAANWIVLGETSGRGRMDQEHKRHGVRVKTIMVYPLVKNAARRLRNVNAIN